MNLLTLGLVIGATIGSSTSSMGSNKEKGSEKYKNICASCHGVNGISTNEFWPNLAGQKEKYVIKQLRDFKSGERRDPLMTPMAALLNEADMEDVALFISTLK